MAKDYAHAFAICIAKARRNIACLADRPISAAWAVDGNYFAFPEGFFAIGNWTSSFHTGMALLAFEVTREPNFLHHAQRLALAYHEKVTRHRMDTMHDLGFLYSLYSVALHRLTGEARHRDTALRAADELAKRFSAKGNYLQAWGRMDDSKTDYAGLVIIDSLMNLPLLFWAARETGSRFYHEIATRHAETTWQHLMRDDGLAYHAIRFDVATGRALGPAHYCGRAVDSQWARGMAWAIYGFALAYRHCRDARFLDAAVQLGRRFLASLDHELVPMWDFALDETAPRLRDTSAAAIAVCGFAELTVHGADPAFATAPEKLLRRLCAPDTLDENPSCPGVLRHAQVSDGPGRAKNVYASWGDYFFMEALARRLHRAPGYW